MSSHSKSGIGVIFNGTPLRARRGARVADFLRAQGLRPERQVVELNGVAMGYAAFSGRALNDGDRIEVFGIVAGG